MFRHLVLAAALSAVLAGATVVGCRGGGANPSAEDVVIPFVEPTVSDRLCQNATYPSDAPQFDEVGEDADWLTTASGLRQVVLKEGDGASPSPDWRVTVKYTGWLADGCVFGTTYTTDDEVRFFLSDVIQGWRESMQDMQVGERRRIRIPPDLGYGASGRPPVIPSNAELVFDVELVKTIPPEDANATATAVSIAAAATITAVSEQVDATFTAEAELTQEAGAETPEP